MIIDNREIPCGSKVKWNFLAAQMTVNKIEVPVTVINAVKDGPTVVITAGVPLGKSGSTNLLKAQVIDEEDI